MRIIVDKMPENREDCIFYSGDELYDEAYINMKLTRLYKHYCNDGKECDFSCGKCSRLKVLN